jgi:AraC family ethanolamine operon transcriptional activator
MRLYAEKGNALVHQCGRGRPGTLIFGIPLEMKGAGAFNGRRWQGGIHAFCGELALDALVPPMTLLVIEVDRQALVDYAWTVRRLRAEQWVQQRKWLHLGDPVRCGEVAARCAAILRICEANPVVLTNSASCGFIQEAVFEVLVSLIEEHPQPVRPTLGEFSRMQVMRRAREYIVEHIEEPVQICDICKAVGVSRRMLQQSFQETVNVNPVAYLRLLRLNGARRDLQRLRDASAQVKDVAARWGFWHLSRFSNEYRQMYNERPSETLRGLRLMTA